MIITFKNIFRKSNSETINAYNGDTSQTANSKYNSSKHLSDYYGKNNLFQKYSVDGNVNKFMQTSADGTVLNMERDYNDTEGKKFNIVEGDVGSNYGDGGKEITDGKFDSATKTDFAQNNNGSVDVGGGNIAAKIMDEGIRQVGASNKDGDFYETTATFKDKNGKYRDISVSTNDDKTSKDAAKENKSIANGIDTYLMYNENNMSQEMKDKMNSLKGSLENMNLSDQNALKAKAEELTKQLHEEAHSLDFDSEEAVAYLEYGLAAVSNLYDLNEGDESASKTSAATKDLPKDLENVTEDALNNISKPEKGDYPVEDREKARKSSFTVTNHDGTTREIDVYDKDDKDATDALIDYQKSITDASPVSEAKSGWIARAGEYGDDKYVNDFLDTAESIIGETPTQENIKSMTDALNNWSKSVDRSKLSPEQEAEFDHLLSKGFQMIASAKEVLEESQGKDNSTSSGNKTSFSVKKDANNEKTFSVYDRADNTEKEAKEEVKSLADNMTEGENSWDEQANSLSAGNDKAKEAVRSYLKNVTAFLSGDLSATDSIQKLTSSLNGLNDAMRSTNLSPENEAKLNRLLEQGFQVVAGIAEVAEKQGSKIATRNDAYTDKILSGDTMKDFLKLFDSLDE